MTRPPRHDDVAAPGPGGTRTEGQKRALLPLVERAEQEEPALAALLVDLDEQGARLCGRILGERLFERVKRREIREAAAILRRIGPSLREAAVRQALLGGLAMAARPAALVHEAADYAEAGGEDDVAALLDALPEETLPQALAGAATIESRDRRRLVFERLELHKEALVGAAAALGSEPPPPEAGAIDLLRLLEAASAELPPAQRPVAALDAVCAHPSARVRQEALKALVRLAPPDLARQRILAALDGSDASLRRVSLDHVMATRLADAVPRLRRLVSSHGFDELEYADKRRVLAALVAIAGAGAHGLIRELFDQRNLLRRHAVEESRIAAACALALLRDDSAREEIERLRQRTPRPLQAELDSALLFYERQTAPGQIAQKEASVRLGSQAPPGGYRPGSAPRVRALSETGAAARPPPTEKLPALTGEAGQLREREPGELREREIDLDAEPPLLPTSHVSVPHASGSRIPSTRPRSEPRKVAARPPSSPIPATRARDRGEPAPAGVVDRPRRDRDRQNDPDDPNDQEKE